MKNSNVKVPQDRPFLTQVSDIRKRAREHIEQGAVTSSYQGDLQTNIRLLNEALATEIVCWLRYTSHFHMAEGINAEAIKEEFAEHAQEELEHAQMIATRIKQLGGVPNMNPAGLVDRSHAEFLQGSTLQEMIREDLIAERVAIESYREMIQLFGSLDPTSRRLLEHILSKEEEHAEELAGLLQSAA